MSTQGTSFGSRASRAFRNLLVAVVLVALAGAVAVLLSELNSRTYTLELDGQTLVVRKGRMLPVGTETYRPADASLADTYAPIELDGTAGSSLAGQKFNEREQLDRALFSLLEQLARPRVTSDDSKELERGLYYLRRAERLTGLTEEQHLSLKAMQAEVAFYQARSKLEEAQRLISESLTQLKLAGMSKNRHARNANQMIVEVEPAATALQESLRKAVHALSAPAEEAAGPPPLPSNRTDSAPPKPAP